MRGKSCYRGQFMEKDSDSEDKLSKNKGQNVEINEFQFQKLLKPQVNVEEK